MYILCATSDSCVRYAPLYVHKFRLVSPHKLLEAQKFNQKYHSYDEIRAIPDKLRWCRHHLGMMQKEVADQICISRGMYIEYENGGVECYPKEVVDKLAALYQVPVEDLLDDFNRFLYYGQGQAIRRHRESLGLGKRAYARQMKLELNSLRAWENEKKQITKNSWEKHFKGVIVV